MDTKNPNILNCDLTIGRHHCTQCAMKAKYMIRSHDLYLHMFVILTMETSNINKNDQLAPAKNMQEELYGEA